MKARLAFRYETNSLQCLGRISDKSCGDSCTAHLGLLLPFPTVGMTEDKVDVVADRIKY